MSVSLKSLIERLTPAARQALEQAANRALGRTHFEVEIEHVLLALLDQQDNAAQAALLALGIPADTLGRELDAAQDSFRTGNTRNPVLSAWLPRWLEKARLLASMEHSEADISTLDLLLALWHDDALRNAVQSSSRSLAAQGRYGGAARRLSRAAPPRRRRQCIACRPPGTGRRRHGT
ncbi:Clp protease N-terminal domain-containing protein [Paludibacterium denitrificans]|uniref:Clp protease N-terminal domain-containing protein n=1 Tax=Paludibacterium denitrificans TaxID=2675226 RepID=UPI001E282B20